MATHYRKPPEKERISNQMAKGEAPYTAIAFIEMLDAGGMGWVGSGSLIAPQFVLTAAHVLAGKVSGQVTFAYDMDVQDNAQRRVVITAACIPATYPGTAGWDIGVARLAKVYNGTSGFHFNLDGQGTDRSQALDLVKTKKGMMTLAGYPGAVTSLLPTEFPQIGIGHLYGKSGGVFDYHFEKNRLAYQFDTRGGESGSPVYVHALRDQQVGVHTHWESDETTGVATLITSDVLAWVKRAVQNLAGGGAFLRQVA
jgi:V8-like Glu-specific endopeptidase